jgi:hypothetical protein
LPEILAQHSINSGWEPSNLHLYADDQQLYKSCRVSELNESTLNKLKPNVGRHKFQIIGTKNQLSKINDIEQIKLDIGEECIRPEDTVVNLGMTLDQHLLCRPHVERLWKESIRKLRQLKSIRECPERLLKIL